jgi:hypothetical protein
MAGFPALKGFFLRENAQNPGQGIRPSFFLLSIMTFDVSSLIRTFNPNFSIIPKHIPGSTKQAISGQPFLSGSDIP